MEKINQKLTTMIEALGTLKESINLFDDYQTSYAQEPTKKNELLFKGLRDSMIQRFEYCTDLFWKVLKIYLQDVEKVELPTFAPRGIIREAVKAKTISEEEGEQSIDMVNSRNESSHIYHEEIAENIAQKVPGFYTLLSTVLDRVQKSVREALRK